MRVQLDSPVVNRFGVQMIDNSGGNEQPATIRSLLLQVLDSPLPTDSDAGLTKRIQLSKITRNIAMHKESEIELNSSEATLLLERAAAFPSSSIIFEQIVDALDPARWRD